MVVHLPARHKAIDPIASTVTEEEGEDDEDIQIY